METPFFGGTYQSLSPNVAADRCMNLYPEVMETHQGKQIGSFYSTPGQRFLANIGTGPIRGQRTMTATRKMIVVVGNTVYTYDQNGAIVTIGTLNTATGPVSIIDNGAQFLVVDGFQGWVYSAGAWTLTSLTNPVVATIQDGFGLVNQLGTDKFFQSNLNDLTIWDGLNFSSADSEPSPIIGMVSLFRQVWIFKQNSTEIWNNAGLNGFAFQRMQGAYLQQGCIAPFSVVVSGDRVLWLGQDKEGGVCVFMNSGYQEQRVSTHPIEYAILSYMQSSQIGVADAIAFSYMQAGHRFYVLTFPSGNATWVYDQTNGMWHERGEFSNGNYYRWDPASYAFFQGQHIVGSSSGNQISTLDLSYGTDDLPVNLDAINPKRWMRRWRALKQAQNVPVRLASLRLDMQTGVNIPASIVVLGNYPGGFIGDIVSYMFTATGGVGPLTFSLASGTLPPGLSLNSSGVLSGTLTTLGTYTFSVKATDPLGNSGQNLDISIVTKARVAQFHGNSGGDQLNTPYASPIISTGNFTIEGRISINDATFPYGIVSGRNSNIRGWAIQVTAGVLCARLSMNTGIIDGANNMNAGGSITPNTLNHFAWTRNGDVFTLWLNGVATQTQTMSGSIDEPGVTSLSLGTSYAAIGENPLLGFMDWFAFSSGVCRYTSNFVPPSSASSIISATSGLDFNEPVGSTVFHDQTGRIWTTTGGVIIATYPY